MQSLARIASDEMHWAEEIRRGNKSAYSMLFDAYYKPLCDYAFRYCNGNREVVEDVVQEVFVRIWEKRTQWNPKVAVKAYLYRSVHNQAITNLRKKRYETPMSDAVEATSEATDISPIDEIYNRQIDVNIKLAIAKLPERRREILILRMLHDMSYKEIADTLEISVNTVDTQLRRSLKTLREELKLFQSGMETV